MKKYAQKTVKAKLKGTPKENNRHGHGKFHGTLGRREKRHQEAVARDRERATRSAVEQLARLDKGKFTAKRERTRLNGRKGKAVS